MLKLGILGSTRGSHLSAIADAIQQKILPAEIKLVLSNKKDALIIKRAQDHQLPVQFVDSAGLTREQYDNIISDLLMKHHVDLIVLIGYMRILSVPFVSQWQEKIINVHPSLLPAYAGLMDLAVHEAVIKNGDQQSGCTVHYVTADVDAGPIILQKTCNVLHDDTPASLKSRIQQLEAQALIEAITQQHTSNQE
jgi:phosphoribosylglycinamide formyltransferase 1